MRTLFFSRQCLSVGSQDINDRLEGEPFRDVVSRSEHLAELGSGELLGAEVLVLGVVGGDVSLLLGVDKVERRDRGDTELVSVLLGNVLGLVGTVVVLSGDGRLGASHVTSNDEMCASKVLTDDHVLDGLTRSGHVHGVRKVLPLDTRVGGFLLENLVGLVTDISGNVIGLGRSAGGVNKDNTVLTDKRIIQSTGEKLVVSTVDGVTALEGNDVNSLGKTLTNLSGGTAREVTDRGVESSDLSSHVVLSTLCGNHEGTRVLDGTGSVALEALKRLVGLVLVGQLNCGDGKVSLLEEDNVSGLEFFVISVENDGKAENGSVGESHGLDDALVLGLLHEAGEGGESSGHDELKVAKLTLGGLKDNIDLGNRGFLLFVTGEHEVHKGSSMGLLACGSKLSKAINLGQSSSLGNEQ